LAFFIAAKQISHKQWKIKLTVILVHLVCGEFVLNISSIKHNAVIHFGWQAVCSFMILAAMTVFTPPLHFEFSISREL
jgi:hypothetical protein